MRVLRTMKYSHLALGKKPISGHTWWLLLIACGLAYGPSTAAADDEQLFPVMTSVVPIGDGLEFSLGDSIGCQSRNSRRVLHWGVIINTGFVEGTPVVPGCWERLPDGGVRVYIDAFKKGDVITVPADQETVRGLLQRTPNEPSGASLRAS